MAQGRLLGGRYALLDALGTGGFGTVYRAEDITLKRPVAAKILNVDAAVLPAERTRITERFLREAQALAALTHPNIVVCHDFGLDGNTAFMVMELVVGRSLADEEHERTTRSLGPLDVTEAVHIAMQICAGLGAAHAAGLVHRDLKPANVMLTETGNVKIVDFGIAQLSERSRLTRTGMYVGTYAYSAPEQASMSGTDARADLYSLGCMIHEMVSGRYAYDAETDLQWMKAHQMEAPIPLRRHLPNAPEALEALVLQLLAKSADERPATADVVRARLDDVARTLPPRGERRYAPRIAATPSAPALSPQPGGPVSPVPLSPSPMSPPVAMSPSPNGAPVPMAPVAPQMPGVPSHMPGVPPQVPGVPPQGVIVPGQVAQPAYRIPATPPPVPYAAPQPQPPGFPPPGGYVPGYAAPAPRSRKVPLPAWIFGGVVVVAVIVLVVVLTMSGSGGGGGGGTSANAGCATLRTQLPALEAKIQSDSSSEDIAAMESDISQMTAMLNNAADESSGQTATDIRQLANDFDELNTDLQSLDLTAMTSLESRATTDGDKIDADCGF